MKHTSIGKLAITVALLSTVACSGSSTGTSSATQSRSVTGTVTSASGSFNALRSAVADCLADTIIATDTSGNTSTATVDEGCNFSLSIQTGRSYAISLVLDGQFVANLIFDSGISGFGGSAFNVDDSDVTINLGDILINGNIATSQYNPLEYCDSDDDGVFDLDDDDDDGDGLEDHYESDCDFDGYMDDYDDDECLLSDSNILRVKPYNGDDDTDLDREVKVYAGCTIDQSTVTAESFSVTSEITGHVVACTFEFSEELYGTEIKCKHDADPFDANAEYTVSLSGIRCDDASELGDGSWSFSTELEDDDDGDYEDLWDDEDEDDSDDDTNDADDSSDDDDSDDSSDD